MTRMFSMTLLFFVVSLPALAIPSRPRYDPPAPPAAPPSFIDLRDTRWYGKTYENVDQVLHFEPSGRLSWSHSGSNYTTGSWRQDGNAVYIEMNNKYAEFKGVINGDSITGGWWNVTGLRWPNPLYRQPLPK